MTPSARTVWGWSVPFSVFLGVALPGQDFLERAKLTTFEATASSIQAVAMSGDTIIVGDPRFGGPGAVLVYEKPAGGWTSTPEVAVLTPSDGVAGDAFGTAVAIEGDTIVVGAHHPLSISLGNGAAYVFEKPAGGWTDMTETVRFGPCCATAGYTFGASVAIAGDTIVIGATQFNQQLELPGGAHVFEKAAGASWSTGTETARLAASNSINRDLFGASLAIAGDFVFVGAPDATIGGNDDQGAVYIFQRPATGWVPAFENGILSASNGSIGDRLGASLQIDDGILAAGSPGANFFSGAVLIFEEPASGWATGTESASLTPSDGFIFWDFGIELAFEDDLIAVNSPRANVGGPFGTMGAVYLFERGGSSWQSATESAKLVLSPRQTIPATFGPTFAVGIALENGVLGVGAPRVQPAGAIYLFEEPPVTPNSGCGLGATDLTGSTRLLGTLDMGVSPCSGGGAAEFIFGVPLAQPFAFPSALSCTGASPCLLSCNPVIRIPGPALSFTWANDPAFVGISLCLQGLCIQQSVPCLELSNMVTITITS